MQRSLYCVLSMSCPDRELSFCVQNVPVLCVCLLVRVCMYACVRVGVLTFPCRVLCVARFGYVFCAVLPLYCFVCSPPCDLSGLLSVDCDVRVQNDLYLLCCLPCVVF